MVQTKDSTRQAFAKRLHKAIDMYDGAPEGHGRAAWLKKELPFDVSAKGAGKWLNGESMPTRSNMERLADFLGVSRAWLSTGEGMPRPTNDEAMRRYANLTPDQKALIDRLIFEVSGGPA